MSAIQIKKVSWWHQSIVDWELAHPNLMMKDCALHFQVTESWLSTVRNSDAFKEYQVARRAQHDGNISKGIVHKTQELASLTLDVLNERVAAEREKLGLTTVKDTCEMALKSLGFGQKAGAGPAQQNNTVIMMGAASREDLIRARAAMRTVRSVEEGGEPIAITGPVSAPG